MIDPVVTKMVNARVLNETMNILNAAVFNKSMTTAIVLQKKSSFFPMNQKKL